MISVCQFTFVQTLGRCYARSGIIHPSAAGRRVTQKSQQRPACVPQINSPQRQRVSSCTTHTKSGPMFDKGSQHPAMPSWKHSRVQRKLPLPAVSWNSCPLPSCYEATKVLCRGMKESAQQDNYRLYLESIFLSRVNQPAHPQALRRKSILCSIYCKETAE